MPAPNPKNIGLSPIATDLGLGLPESGELIDEEERRKRLKLGQASLPSEYGDSVLGNASMSLFSGSAGPRK